MKTILVLISLLISVASFQAHACSCAEWESASEIMQSADAVVLGVPTDAGTFYSSDEEMREDIYRTGINIVKRFKGKYKKFMYILAAQNTGANCGISFKPYDGLYLIIGFKAPGMKYYVTEGCSVGYVTPDNEYTGRLISELMQMQ